MSCSKESRENFFEGLLNKYLRLLQERPLVTKACTSASVSALGNFISQKVAPNPDGKICWRSTASYAIFAFFFSTPIIHYFYIYLEKISPQRKDKPSKFQNIQRLIIDRLIFTPPFLALFLYFVSLLEGHGHAVAMRKVKESFWTILKMNWKVWTVFSYININYIPQKYRVLFGNIVGLFWSVIVAVQRRKMAGK